MGTKKTSEATYTKDQVRDIVADVLSELVIKLEDPSLVVASMFVMTLLTKKLK